MEVENGMYWVSCPKCGVKLLKIQSGVIETICSTGSCKAKWLIIVDGGNFRYERVEETLAPNSS